MNPKTLQMSLNLTEVNPVAELDESKLTDWELSQIESSVKKNKISISVQIEDLLKSDEKPELKEVVPTKKRATRKPKV